MRELDERGRIVFDEFPGAHMHFTLQYFEERVVNVYLRGGGSEAGTAVRGSRADRDPLVLAR